MQILFEFVDGPYDGKVLEGVEGDSSDAARYFLITNHGTVGLRFKVVSDFAVENLARQRPEQPRQPIQHHYYTVVECVEDGGQVLVRASYDFADPERKAPRPRRENSPPRTLADQAASHQQQVQRFFARAARGIAESYGPCWPASTERSKQAPNVGLHMAHVMLQDDFSVFASAPHSDPARKALDLVGIAPSQDWFVALQCRIWDRIEELPELIDDVELLKSFWLNTRLTIDACADHMIRMANYCEHGYGVVAGLHWSPAAPEESLLRRFWVQPAEAEKGPAADVANKLVSLGTTWERPLLVRQVSDQGAYHLLFCWFEIKRPNGLGEI